MSMNLANHINPFSTGVSERREQYREVHAGETVARRSAWFIASIIAVLTSLVLFHIEHFYYPLTLLLSHVLGASFLKLFQLFRQYRESSWTKSPANGAPIMVALWTVAVTMSTVPSLVLSYHAVLHCKNSLYAIMLLYLQIDLLRISHEIFRPTNFLSRFKWLGLLLAMALVCRYEPRVTPDGLSYLLTALLTTVLSRLTTDKLSSYGEHHALRGQTIVLVVLVLGLLWGTQIELNLQREVVITFELCTIFIINHIAGALALYLGGHIFTDLDHVDVNDSSNGQSLSLSQTSPIMTGVIGLLFDVFGREINVVIWQIAAYFAAWACTLYPPVIRSSSSSYDALHTDSPTTTPSEMHLSNRMNGHAEEQDEWQAGLDEYKASESVPRRAWYTSSPIKNWLFGCGCLAWLVLILESLQIFSMSSFPPPAIIDSDYEPKRALDMVLAYHSESHEDVIDTVTSLLPSTQFAERVILYNKGGSELNEELSRLVREQISDEIDVKVIDRPNIGREAETYLSHILEHWDDLAKHTIFVQAKVDNLDTAQSRVRTYLVEQTGFLSFSWVDNICTKCANCKDTSNWDEYGTTIDWIYNMSHPAIDGQPQSSCQNLVLGYNGQFIVSARRLRGLGKGMYEELLDALVNPDSKQHSAEYLDSLRFGGGDSLNAPFFGYTMERMWPTIMQCSGTRIANRCPSLWAGKNGALVELEDCQCLDGPVLAEL